MFTLGLFYATMTNSVWCSRKFHIKPLSQHIFNHGEFSASIWLQALPPRWCGQSPGRLQSQASLMKPQYQCLWRLLCDTNFHQTDHQLLFSIKLTEHFFPVFLPPRLTWFVASTSVLQHAHRLTPQTQTLFYMFYCLLGQWGTGEVCMRTRSLPFTLFWQKKTLFCRDSSSQNTWTHGEHRCDNDRVTAVTVTTHSIH